MRPLSSNNPGTFRGIFRGRYGRPGKAPGEFGLIHWVDRASDGSIFVTEILNWRVQRLVPVD